MHNFLTYIEFESCTVGRNCIYVGSIYLSSDLSLNFDTRAGVENWVSRLTRINFRPMVAEMLNIVGLHIPKSLASRHGASICQQLGLAADTPLSDISGYTSDSLCDSLGDSCDSDRGDPGGDGLTSLSPSDVRCLLRTEDELSACDGWQRLLPSSSSSSSSSSQYLNMMTSVSRRDVLLHTWEARVWYFGHIFFSQIFFLYFLLFFFSVWGEEGGRVGAAETTVQGGETPPPMRGLCPDHVICLRQSEHWYSYTDSKIYKSFR